MASIAAKPVAVAEIVMHFSNRFRCIHVGF